MRKMSPASGLSRESSISIATTRVDILSVARYLVVGVVLYLSKLTSALGHGQEIPDVAAYTGKAFFMSFSSHPVYGSPDISVQLSASSELGGDHFPSWLWFNSTTRSLSGVPLAEDQGGTLLTIKAKCNRIQDHSSSYLSHCYDSKDMFHLNVSTLPWTNILVSQILLPNSVTEFVSDASSFTDVDSAAGVSVAGDYSSEEERAVASLILCASAEEISSRDRLNLMSHLSNFLNIPVAAISLERSSTYLLKAVENGFHVISAGPGSDETCNLSQNIEILWWLPGSTIQHLDDFVRVLQHNVDVGRLQKEINTGIIGWYVASSNYVLTKQNRRRRVAGHHTVVPTPALSPLKPTAAATSQVDSVTISSIYLSSQTVQPSSNLHVTFTGQLERSSQIPPALAKSLSYVVPLSFNILPKSSHEKSQAHELLSSFISTANVISSFTLSSTSASLPQILAQPSSTEVTLSSEIHTVLTHQFTSASTSTYSSIQHLLERGTLIPCLATATPDLSFRHDHSKMLSSSEIHSLPKDQRKTASAFVYSSIQPTTGSGTVIEHTTAVTPELPSRHDPSSLLFPSPSTYVSFLMDTTSRTLSATGTSMSLRHLEFSSGFLTQYQDSETDAPGIQTMSLPDNIETISPSPAFSPLEVYITVKVATKYSLPHLSPYFTSSSSLSSVSPFNLVTSRDAEVVTSILASRESIPAAESGIYPLPSPSDDASMSSETVHYSRDNATIYEYSSSTPFSSMWDVGVTAYTHDTLPRTTSLASQYKEMGQNVTLMSFSEQEQRISTQLPHAHMTSEDSGILVSPSLSLSDKTASELFPSSKLSIWSSNAMANTSPTTSHFLEKTEVESTASGDESPSKAIFPTSALSSGTAFSSTTFFHSETIDNVTSTTEVAGSSVAAKRGSVTETSVTATSKPTSQSSLSTLYSTTVTRRTRTRTTTSTTTTTTAATSTSVSRRAPLRRQTTTSKVRTTTQRWTPRWDDEDGDYDTDKEQLNNRPYVQKSIKVIRADQGRLLEFNVPHDVFYDIEDGDTRHLSLSLELPSNQAVPSNFWLYLESAQQVIKGLPLHEDMDIKNMSVVLVARDGEGLEATDYITLQINDTPRRSFTHVFRMKFTIEFQQFMHSRRNITALIEKIGTYFGDPGAKFITVLEVRQGSFMLSWTNNTLTGATCQTDVIKFLFGQMVRKDGAVRSSFSRHVGRHLQLKEVQIQPWGSCNIPPTTTTVATTTHLVSEIRGHGFSIWAHVILPVLIAVLVFILIILIMIFCNRRRRQQQTRLNVEKEAISNDCNPILFPSEFEADDASSKSRDPQVLPADPTPNQNIPPGSLQAKNNLNRDQERARRSRDNREQEWLNRDNQIQDLEHDRDWGRNTNRRHTKDGSTGRRQRDHDRMSRVSASSTLSWDRPNNHYLEEEAGSRSSTLKSTKSTGSDRRHRKSPPPYWQSQADPPPYRMPPPYLSNNSTQL